MSPRKRKSLAGPPAASYEPPGASLLRHSREIKEINVSSSAFDVNNRDGDVLPVLDELEGDYADLSFILSRLRRIYEMMPKGQKQGKAGIALLDLIFKVQGRRQAYLGELARLRTPED